MGQEREIVTLDDMYEGEDSLYEDTGTITKADLGSFFGGITNRLPWKKKAKQPRAEFTDITPVAPTTTKKTPPRSKRGLGHNDINDTPESTTGWLTGEEWTPGYSQGVRESFPRNKLEQYWPKGTKR